MEQNKFQRICPARGNGDCFNSMCQHQCFMDEVECRKPESEKTWEKLMKEFNNTPWQWGDASKYHPHPVTIHIHNDLGPFLESFLSIHQKLDKIMSTQTELAAQVQAIGT